MFKGLLQQNAVFFALLVSFTTVLADDPKSLPENNPLSYGSGYLLIGLDVGGTAPSFEYARTRRNGIDRAKATVELKGKDKGFLLLPIKRGTYQITKINAPYFDLPFWLGTAEDEDWKFTVEPNKINYLGHLKIGKKRRSRTVNVKLLNRIATDLGNITLEYKNILNQYPLSISNRFRDDFYALYTRKDGE